MAAVIGASVCAILTISLATTDGPKALGVGAFMLVAVWCFTHRRVDHTLVALVLYLGLLDGYVKLKTGSPTVTLARDALVIAIAAGALVRASQSKERLTLPPLGGFVLAFSAVVLIELTNPGARGLTAGLAGVRQHLEFVPLFFLGYAFVRTESQIRTALVLLVICAALGGVVSYIQSNLTPEELASWGVGYRERVLGTGAFVGHARVAFDAAGQSVRPFGLGSEVGSGAALAGLALPGLIALLLAAKRRGRWLMVPLSVGVGLAVATSGSRAAIVVACLSLAAFGLLTAASKNAVRGVAGITVGVALIYSAFVQLGPNHATVQRAQSVAPTQALGTFARERGGSVIAFGGLARDHPLGVGLGTVGPASSFASARSGGSYNSETEWNFLVVEVGLAGVVIYVLFLLRIMWLSLTRIRRVGDTKTRLYLAALAAPIFGLVAAGFSGPVSAAPPHAPYLWLVSGVLAYWLVTAYRQGGLGLIDPDDPGRANANAHS